MSSSILLSSPELDCDVIVFGNESVTGEGTNADHWLHFRGSYKETVVRVGHRQVYLVKIKNEQDLVIQD